MYTDKTKFVGTIFIESKALAMITDSFLQDMEDEILTDLLGYELYKDLKADDSNSKYTDLLNGVEYTDSDVLKYCEGIVKMLPQLQYYYGLRNIESFTTSLGMFEAEAENGVRSKATLNRKITTEFNKGIKLYYELVAFIQFKNRTDDTYYDGFEYKIRSNINVLGL